jgi:hypothetical protein
MEQFKQSNALMQRVDLITPALLQTQAWLLMSNATTLVAVLIF